jgi:beta-glucosidase
VVYAWYGGQEAGHAIGDVLFGAVNPSGKLPVTFPKALQDSPAYGHYPGENLHVEYAEGIYVGYRGFDKHDVEPLFPFGYGPVVYHVSITAGLIAVRIGHPMDRVGTSMI